MIYDKKLKPCPLCGAKAFVNHDVVDGHEFGWSVGCPRACIADGVHGFNDPETFRQAKLTMFNFSSKEVAIKAWNKRCEGGVQRMNKHDATIYLKGIKDFYGLDKDSEEAIDMAIEALQDDWIPVSERLPKKGEVVLITNGKGNVRCGQYRSEYDVRDETHYWWWKGKTVETVLAWRPLPAPYKESDNE